MSTYAIVELPEGAYFVPEEAFALLNDAELQVWLRECWRALRGGGMAANECAPPIARREPG